MQESVSYLREEETPEAKAAWFQSLSLEERMELLCSYTDLILDVNPAIQEKKHAEPTKRSIQVLSRS